MRAIFLLLALFHCHSLFSASSDNIMSVPLASQVLTKKISEDKHISLNFQEIKVRAVLQLLADFTGINIVVSDKVKGNLTLQLNDIPWKQALEIILTTRSLGRQQIGDVMLIAPLEELLEHKKKKVNTALNLKNLAPLRSSLIRVKYAKAPELAAILQNQNTTLLSKRGSISVDARTNTIWVQESDSQLAEIKELVNSLDVPVKQVLIEARIVNVTKDFARDLGLRFALSKAQPITTKLAPATQLGQTMQSDEASPLGERLNLDLAAMPLSGTPASIGVALAKLGNGILLDLELSALESEGRGKVVSSPRIITSNQQTAVIQSGEEIPYQEATSNGATTVAFKKAVLSLKVTPQITPDGKIQMDLHINQDIPSVKVFNGVPSIVTKEIQTAVLINNGQTIVLGGIYKQDKYHAVHQVPFFGDLPVIGNLFKNRSMIERNEELLIFITPRIITNNLS